MYRASTGPAVAMTKTYDVASAATAGMDVPTNPMMINENSPLAMSAVPAQLPAPRHAIASGGENPGGNLRRRSDRGQGQCYREHRKKLVRVDRKADRKEEDGGEQVAQRAQHLARPVRRLTGQSQAHQERADGGRCVQDLRHHTVLHL